MNKLLVSILAILAILMLVGTAQAKPLAEITYPTSGDTVNGTVNIIGTADVTGAGISDNLTSYNLSIVNSTYGTISWYNSTDNVTDGILYTWSTSDFTDGNYNLTLYVYNESTNVNTTFEDPVTLDNSPEPCIDSNNDGSCAGETNYTTIQFAVNAASQNDVILLPTGIYRESVDVDVDSLTIRSGSSPFQDCGGSYCYNITADDEEIYGIDMYNAGIKGAIWQDKTVKTKINNTVIKACTIHDNVVGINISDGQNNTVAFNNFDNNTNFGIFYGNTTNFDNATLYNLTNLANGWYIDGEYNYWYEEKGPVYCTALNTSDIANCTVHKVTGIPQGDNVSGVDYTPWLRAKVFDYVLVNVTGVNVTVDATDVADTNVTVSTTSGDVVSVFVAGFWGNPGTDFVTNIGRFAAVEFNDTASVVNMTMDMYYNYEDMYGKLESSSKMYYWDGKADDYWLNTTPNGTLDTTDSGVYTGHLSVYLDNTSSSSPLANASSDVMFGIGTYSDPVGGVALPTDKIVVTSTYVIASIVAALGIAIAVRRKE